MAAPWYKIMNEKSQTGMLKWIRKSGVFFWIFDSVCDIGSYF